MFIPFRDDNPTRNFPLVTVGLIALNTLVLLYMSALSADEPEALDAFMKQAALYPASFAAGAWTFEAWRSVFTSMFLHAGAMHLAGNMLYLWIFGNNIEDIMGTFKFLVFYLVCGAAATFAHIYAVIAGDPSGMSVPTVGASGAIAGVLGAYLIKFPTAKVETCVAFIFITVIRLPAILVLGGWFLLQLLNGTGSLIAHSSAADGVAWWAHIGGFAAGMVLVNAFAGRSRPRYRG